MAARPRRKARGAVKDMQAKYDAAGTGRRLKGWTPPSSGPNTAIVGLQNIRNRARDAARNDWSGESAIQKWTTTLVGVGITPRWSKAPKDLKTRLSTEWAAWGKVADADEVLDVYGLQALITRAWLDGGECFLRRRRRDLVLGLPAPVQIQVVEADFVPLFDADVWQGLPAGNNIRQGIERNKFGRRVAYWMYREHPGDRSTGLKPNSRELIRVPAGDVRHVYEVKRPGQLRGVSTLAPVLARLRMTGDFEDTVLDRQRLANLFTMFITKAMPPDSADIDYDSETGLPKWYDKNGLPMVGLESGISQELEPGENVTFANPPEAGTTYSDYLRSTLMGTASGGGLPYELFSGDIRDISDRTLRVVLNEFRRFAKQRQWHTIIPQACQGMVQWWAEALALAGKITLDELEVAANPEHAPHGWEHIHPVQDVEGKALMIEKGLASRAGVVGEQGDDIEAIDEERARDREREERLKLPHVNDPKPAAGAATAAPPVDPGPNALSFERFRASAGPRDPEEPSGVIRAIFEANRDSLAASATAHREANEAMLAASRAQSEAMLAAARSQNDVTLAGFGLVKEAIASLPAPEVNVAAPEVHNVVNVEPTPLEVNVAAPEVHNVVNVEPSEVNVSLPDRHTVSTIERNDKGEIVHHESIEKTLQ